MFTGPNKENEFGTQFSTNSGSWAANLLENLINIARNAAILGF